MTSPNDPQLQETLDRMRAVLANVSQRRGPDPDRQRIIDALDVLRHRDTTQPLTAYEQTVLNFVSRIEASTLGTPHAQQLRRQTSPDTISTVLQRADQLAEAHETGRNNFLAFVKRHQGAASRQVPAEHDADHRLDGAIENVLGIAVWTQDAVLPAGGPDWVRSFIFRYCRARIGSTGATAFEHADAVAKEAFVEVLNVAALSDTDRRTFLPTVYDIAKRKVAGHHARVWVDTGNLDDAPVAGGTEPNQSDEVLIDLLRTLPSRQREIVILRLLVGLSAEETATVLGMTPGAVRVTQHRVLAKLRNEPDVSADRFI